MSAGPQFMPTPSAGGRSVTAMAAAALAFSLVSLQLGMAQPAGPDAGSPDGSRLSVEPAPAEIVWRGR